MKKFEYEILHATNVQFGKFGKYGWELVSVDNGMCYFKRELIEASDPEKELNEKLDSPIDIHDLPTRVVFALDYIDVKTYRELINYGRINLLKMRNFGHKSLNEIDGLFEEVGLDKYWYGRAKLKNDTSNETDS